MHRFLLLTASLLLHAGALWAQPTTPAAPVEIPMPRDQVRKFFGTYEFTPIFHLRVFNQNNRLFAQRDGDPEKFELFARTPTIFFLKAMPAELEFKPAPSGAYETLVLHQGGRDQTAHRLTAEPRDVYDTVQHLDSLLYGAYNRRDLPAFLSYFAPTLEFYHDQTGLTNYQENAQRFQENFTKATIMRRELVPGSLEVYPIKDFGAIETGIHRFYQREPGQPEKLVSEPRFLQVWQHTQGRWQLVRVVSYDH